MEHHDQDNHGSTPIHHDGNQSDGDKSNYHGSIADTETKSMEVQTSNFASNLGWK